MGPPSSKDLRLAQLLYYQIYEEEMPIHQYRKQDIDYIIEKLIESQEIGLQQSPFNSDKIH